MSLEAAAADLHRALADWGWGDSPPVPFARGGASQLYLITREDGRCAVLKTPRYEARPAGEHRQIERGLAFEAAVLRVAASPYLPGLIGSDARGRFLLRDFVPGVPLSMSRPGDPALSERLGQLLALARGLFERFHGHQPEAYLLRDLKPVNLIWNRDPPELKLVDVGSARPVSRARARTARKSERLGSGKWLFWAPEQLIERDRLPRESADYFALGATAFFLLTGEAPYPNSDPEPRTALRSYLELYPTAARELAEAARRHGVPEPLTAFLRLCLHPLAEERPAAIPDLDPPL